MPLNVLKETCQSHFNTCFLESNNVSKRINGIFYLCAAIMYFLVLCMMTGPNDKSGKFT